MSGELKVSATTNVGVYAVLMSPYGEHGGQFWSTTLLTFEEYGAPNWPNFAIVLLEHNGSGWFVGNMPALPLHQDEVDVIYYQRAAGATAKPQDTKLRAAQYGLTGGGWIASWPIVV